MFKTLFLTTAKYTIPSHVCMMIYLFILCFSGIGILGLPCGSSGEESACNSEDLGLIPGLGRSPGEGKVYPLQYSGLRNSMGCIVHGIEKSQTQLSNFHVVGKFPFFFFNFFQYNSTEINLLIYKSKKNEISFSKDKT